MENLNIEALYEERLFEINDNEVVPPDYPVPIEYLHIDTLRDVKIQKIVFLANLLRKEAEELCVELEKTYNMRDVEKKKELFQKINVINTLINVASRDIDIYLTERFTHLKSSELLIYENWKIVYPEELLENETWLKEYGMEEEGETDAPGDLIDGPRKSDIVDGQPVERPKVNFFVLQKNEGERLAGSELVIAHDISSEEGQAVENLVQEMNLEGESQN